MRLLLDNIRDPTLEGLVKLRTLRWSAPIALLVLVSCSRGPDPRAAGPGQSDPCSGAWARLFDDANLSDRQLTLAYPTEQASLQAVRTNAGVEDLNDRVSSARWSIPPGCKLVLYEDENFRGAAFQLVGSGRTEQNPNFGSFSDKASSARWERS